MLLSWCRWHLQVLCNLWKCWHKHVMKHLLPWWNEKGATATITKMVPRQPSDDPITHWDTSAKEQVCGCAKHAKDSGVLPDSGFPRYGGMAIEERAKTSLGHSANTSISYNTHAFVHGRRLGVIPLKRVFRNGSSSVRCRGSSRSQVVVGSSCTRFVDELGVTVR